MGYQFEGQPRALLIEDDHDLGPCIHEVLRVGGYETTLVRTLADARAELGERAFDVVVLDVMLGPDHARDLLADFADATDAPPTLLLSAAREAPELADMYGITLVAKPFDLDVFLDEVDRVRRDGRPPSTPGSVRVAALIP